jgi:hypothetical protein
MDERQFQHLLREIAESRRHTDQVAGKLRDELRTHIDEVAAGLRDDITESRRHTDQVADGLRNEITGSRPSHRPDRRHAP